MADQEKSITIKVGTMGNVVDVQGFSDGIEIMLTLSTVLKSIEHEMIQNSKIIMPRAGNRIMY